MRETRKGCLVTRAQSLSMQMVIVVVAVNTIVACAGLA